MGKGLDRRFSKEDIKIAKKHIKRCSIIRETTMRYHCILIGMATIKKTGGKNPQKQNNKCW